jgi:transcriptional regulator with XRE-family HTH domain
MGRFSTAAGAVLRDTRVRLGMTLYDVARVSSGRFKPSALGGYERGERSISIDRFCELARLYGASADELLSQVLLRLDPSDRREIVLDLRRMELVDSWIRGRLAEFVHRIKAVRRDYETDVITLRSGDIAAIAAAAGRSTGEIVSGIAPVLRPVDTTGGDN